MRRRLLATSSFACLMLLIMANTVFAQTLRPQRTFYFYPKAGLTNYTGDRDPDLTALWDADDEASPVGGGLEIGYQFTTRFSLGGEGSIGMFPTANVESDESSPVAYFGKLIGRWTIAGSRARIAPFVEAGLFGSTAVEANDDDGEWGLGIGPLFGLGLDFNVAPQLSVMLELQGMMSIPDDGFDGSEAIDGSAFERFDFLNQLSLGLKYSLRRPFTAPIISGLNCPATLQVGQSGTFSASLNDDATEPIEYRWDFGGAGMGTGMTASQTFTRPGNYTVTFTAMNEGGDAMRTCVVNVVPAPIGAEIIGLTANPQRFSACAPTTVTFSANARGDEPLNYRWDFGDGSTGTGANVTHTYSRPGTYTATLTTSNAAGTTNRSITITAEACPVVEDVCADVTELNSVYFPRNSSTLSAEGRAALQENLEILRECPNICVRIEGYAAPGERNPQQLSTDRARAVAQFYQDNGIAASRTTSVGMGLVGGTTTKKEGGTQYQRADSIPVPCR